MLKPRRQDRKWIAADQRRVLAWFGSYARKTAITSTNHADLASCNALLFGNTKLKIGDFYGGGYPVSDPEAVEPHNVNRLLSASTDHGERYRLANVFSFALMFLLRQNRENFIGDLEERFGLILRSNGRRAATTWFWRQVIHSFVSLALDALKRVSGIEKLYRRIGS